MARQFTFVALLSSAALLAIVALAHAQTDAPKPDPILRLNGDFVEAYQALLKRTVPSMSPVIAQCGDGLFLVRDGVEQKVPAFNRRFRELEAVSHVPVTVFVLVVPSRDAVLDQAAVGRLRAYREIVVQARAALPRAGFSASETARQRRVLDRSIAFIDASLAQGSVSDQALRRFTHGETADIIADVHAAAREELRTMDAQVKTWLGELTPAERKRLRVAVCGVHMARIGNVVMQYMAKSLALPYEGRYQIEATTGSNVELTYAESVFDLAGGLKVLATHEVDAQQGSYFFNDPARMHRDLLGEAAEQLLRDGF